MKSIDRLRNNLNFNTPAHKNSAKQCINSFGKAKKTFDTFEKAVEWAKKMNKNTKFIHKQVAYKCKRCNKFHTGRSQHKTLLNHEQNIYKNK